MTVSAIATQLRIQENDVVWIIGGNAEEASLLDPLPLGVELVDEIEDDIDVAVFFADTSQELAILIDEVLPQAGSIHLLWIMVPTDGRSDIDSELVEELISDYGWEIAEEEVLDEAWSVDRLCQA